MRQMAEQMQRRIAVTHFCLDGYLVHLSASIGISTSKTFDESETDLIAQAERALKVAGIRDKNRVFHAG